MATPFRHSFSLSLIPPFVSLPRVLLPFPTAEPLSAPMEATRVVPGQVPFYSPLTQIFARLQVTFGRISPGQCALEASLVFSALEKTVLNHRKIRAGKVWGTKGAETQPV